MVPNSRLNFTEANPKVYTDMLAFSRSLGRSSIDPSLRELVNIRVSQINGCAFCLGMHTRIAREKGESEHRLYMLSAWRDALCFSELERLALELAESVTRIADGGVSDDLYERVRHVFDAEQYVDLLAMVNVINSWNRFMIGIGQKEADECAPK
ncbi:MAG: carboxymuconolactone decarboxylase family protein [Fimbriimonas sp.]|nr:carboxymuconolactone decarboxylase family protein [Fimbriimonas sp.]